MTFADIPTDAIWLALALTMVLAGFLASAPE